MNSTKAFIAAVAGALVLAGCAYSHPPGSGDYYGYQAMGEQSVRFGVVDSVRPVRINPGDSGVGTATGAVLGGLAGSTVGGGTGQVAGAVGGALLGGLIGSNVEHDVNTHDGVELTVLLDSGQYVAIVQGADEQFRPGDRVRVVGGGRGGHSRVTH
jgi:outer membrane lipoprotein SlyB